MDRHRTARAEPATQRRPGAVARLRTTTATSAGGIVVRWQAGRPQLVIGSRRRDRDSRTWTLPKGTPDPGETLEETALREVAEETGLEVRITGPLDSIEYWFVQAGQLFGGRRVGGRRFEAALRLGWFDPTTLAGGDLTREIRGAFSYYYARHTLKWQNDVGRIDVQRAGGTERMWEIRSQLQFAF